MNIDTVAILAALTGLFFGALMGTALGIRDEAKKSRSKWQELINRAMRDAYNAGYVDGSTKGQKRPSGNK